MFVGSRKEFIKTYGPFIHYITKDTGILPGTLAAQAILESSGKYNGVWSVGGSGLSRKANNFFGIKAGPNWNGPTINMTTGEQTKSGAKYNVKSDFRVYNSVEDSIRDYVRFLKVNPRYAQVFNKKNVLDQANALKAAGYATAKNYAATVYGVYRSIADELEQSKGTPYAQEPGPKKFLTILIPLITVVGGLYYAHKKGYLNFKL